MPPNRPQLVIPVRTSGEAKSRLASVLKLDQRRKLVRCLLKDLLTHCKELSDRLEYGVVSDDDDVARITEDAGGFVLSEPEAAGNLGEIVDQSIHRGSDHQPESGLLVTPVDLPWVSRSDLESLLDRVADSSLFMVPDEEEAGTNVLWRQPSDVIHCQYEGTSSFEDHLSEAEERGVDPDVEVLEPFQFDLDTSEDWHRLLQRPDRLSEHTQNFVEEFMLDISSTLERLE